MKTNKWTIILFFLLIFLYLGKDILFNFFIKADDSLKEAIILESDYNFLKEDYEKLLEENELWKTMDNNFITSKVVIRDPYLFFEEVTILKGKSGAIEKDDIVINRNGYIGKIKSVHEHYSQVELLTNKNTKLQVKVNSSFGILKKEEGLLKVLEITSKETIEEGSIVYTSGLASIPGNIPVARVTSVKNTPLGQELEVIPVVDFEDITYVTVRKKGGANEP